MEPSVAGGFPSQRAINSENVSMLWGIDMHIDRIQHITINMGVVRTLLRLVVVDYIDILQGPLLLTWFDLIPRMDK